jgi:2-oxoisovalerate dehydrogenase E2 component (dihydrolipoyl transacylase)
MSAHTIKVPDLGEGIAEVELVAWHVKVGDEVHEDQALADVLTDKATIEIPSAVAGRVLALGGEVGQVLAVGAELIRIERAGGGDAATKEAVARPQDTPAPAEAAPTVQSTSAPTTARAAPAPAPVTAPAVPADRPAATAAAPAAPARPPAAAPGATAPPRKPGTGSSTADERPIASPSVRRRAWDLGVALGNDRASGPAGRIMHADVDAYVAAHGAGRPAAVPAAGGVKRTDEDVIPVIGLRRRIAMRMQEAKRHIPHFSYVEEIDVTEVEALRVALNTKWQGERARLTLLPLLMRSIVLAVRDFPQINARFDDDAGIVTRHGAVHIGIATQSEHGLLVPVVRHAEALDLWAAAAEVARLADAARTGRATRDELSGSTITITSLGPLGGIVTTPVINRPEVAIIGVNRMIERPTMRGGAVVPRLLMNLSSSFDHRVVDGIDAARFVQALRAMLEAPAMLFLE